ncbi:MAG: NAD kinase [Microbacteriaceae bacterium]|nr:NAD kinase [Microbacteriaceae bacterium]NBS62176.1 NAD kinase [Microbacteriaceae bacterium]
MSEQRYVLLVTHTGRLEAVESTIEAVEQLVAAKLIPVMTPTQVVEIEEFLAAKSMDSAFLSAVQKLGTDIPENNLELVMVLGGDGTILKAAEIVRESATPLMGINLGHVGFLAESEREGLSHAVARVVARDYLVKERLTLDVRVLVAGNEVYRTWALNEATVEKSAAERMLEVVVEIDRRPLSSFGCDGVIMATPTGSTAYAFSAGGPVVWPSVEAMLLVPLSAHALFSRPMVISPRSLLAVEVLERSAGTGVLWCDGRRTHDLPVGARVEVSRSEKSVRLARLRQGPFTDRIVRKFSLPVTGWRGPEQPAE